MSTKKAKSFNHQVFQKTYKRIKLSPSQRIVFQRLLGFLIRNDNPFPYSAVKMADLTGYCLKTIFNILNVLEKLRLIHRVGLGKNRRFTKGTILKKICATVQNRTEFILANNSPTVQLTTQNLANRVMGTYKKTSLCIKPKDCVGDSFESTEHATSPKILKKEKVEKNALQCEEAQELFMAKFEGRNITLKQIFDACQEHYDQKSCWTTKDKFIKWLKREKADNYPRIGTYDANKKQLPEFYIDYLAYLSQFKNDKLINLIPQNSIQLNYEEWEKEKLHHKEKLK